MFQAHEMYPSVYPSVCEHYMISSAKLIFTMHALTRFTIRSHTTADWRSIRRHSFGWDMLRCLADFERSFTKMWCFFSIRFLQRSLDVFSAQTLYSANYANCMGFFSYRIIFQIFIYMFLFRYIVFRYVWLHLAPAHMAWAIQLHSPHFFSRSLPRALSLSLTIWFASFNTTINGCYLLYYFIRCANNLSLLEKKKNE